MARRRIAYAALLGLAVLFQIFFRFYLSTFTLVLVVLLPVLAAALSLPAALGCAITLSPAAPTVIRGGEASFRLTLECRTPFPLPRVKVRLRWENRLTGEGDALSWAPAPGQTAGELTVPAAHCGCLVCRAEGAWTCDLLGLFPIPLRKPAPAEVLSLPRQVELEVPPGLLSGRSEGAALRPRPGGGPGEDYDLRGYRPGDPLRSVHWKLSSKRDELVVKEILEPHRAALVLTFDRFGAPEVLDETFARLCALSRWLLERQRPHHIRWAGPGGTGTEGRPVDSEAALLSCLALAFSAPAPEAGASMLDLPLRLPGEGGRVRRIHVTASGLEGGGL